MMEQPESAQDFYARIAAATGPDGRLPVAVEEMAGWDIFPYEIDSLRLKPLHPPAEEPARRGQDPATCWCAAGLPDGEAVVWGDDDWRLTYQSDGKLPITLILEPREHYDLGSVPDEMAGRMGRLVVAIAAAVETLPSVARVHLARYGDGGAHLHLFFFGRPARILQMRGSPLLDWEENLPPVPPEVLRANASYVGRRLVERLDALGQD